MNAPKPMIDINTIRDINLTTDQLAWMLTKIYHKEEWTKCQWGLYIEDLELKIQLVMDGVTRILTINIWA